MRLPETIGTKFSPSVEGASPALLSELLQAFEVELRKQGIPVDEYLRPGASEAEVKAGFEECGLVAPLEAIAWFGWRDGPTRVRRSHDVMPMFMGWSLAECVQAYLDPKGHPHGFEDWQWNPNWIQIMGDASGLAICCSAPADEPPLVRSLTWERDYSTQPEVTARQAVSLCTPVTWWIDSLRQGWYQWNVEANAWEDVHSKQSIIRATHFLS